MVVGAFVGVLLVSFLRTSGLVSALSIISPRDCDTNAVISCGALTTKELQQRYPNKGVAQIYNYFGITADDINDIDKNKNVTAGRVYKDGTVVVDGKVVATNAMTAGRENIAGSTRRSSGGTTFYTRPPSVSFRANSIAAFVVMDEDDQFKFAILAACANPVTGTPVPKETPPPPAPPPPDDIIPITTSVSTQTPESTPTAVIETTISPAELPSTGPGSVLVIAALAVIGGYLFHATHRHVRHKRHIQHHTPHHHA